MYNKELNREWKRKNRKRLTEQEKLRRRKLREDIIRKRESKCYLCGYKRSITSTKRSSLEIHHTKRKDAHKLINADILNEDVFVLCFLCHRMINKLKHLININRIDVNELPRLLNTLCQ